MKFAATLAVAASAFLATTATSYAGDIVIKKFDEKTLDAVLAAVGATEITKEKTNDETAVLFTANGLRYVSFLRACRPETGCLGIALQCSFTGETFATTTANTFNFSHTFSVAAVSEDRKTIYLARYIIADGGTTVANATENFKVFFSMPAQLIAHIKKEGEAPIASAAPSMAPVAAAGSAAAITASATPAAGTQAEAAPATHTNGVMSGGAHANVLVR